MKVIELSGPGAKYLIPIFAMRMGATKRTCPAARIDANVESWTEAWEIGSPTVTIMWSIFSVGLEDKVLLKREVMEASSSGVERSQE